MEHEKDIEPKIAEYEEFNDILEETLDELDDILEALVEL